MHAPLSMGCLDGGGGSTAARQRCDQLSLSFSTNLHPPCYPTSAPYTRPAPKPRKQAAMKGAGKAAAAAAAGGSKGKAKGKGKRGAAQLGDTADAEVPLPPPVQQPQPDPLVGAGRFEVCWAVRASVNRWQAK